MVAAPSIDKSLPNVASRLTAALLRTTAPPCLIAKLFRMCRGVLIPPCASRRVLVAASGALMTRLLIVSVVGAVAAVVTSLFTVLVPAFVINTSERPLYGGTFSDQLGPVSHLPLKLLVQLSMLPPATTCRAFENSVVPLPVAVMNTPGKMAAGKLTEKLPPASVAMFVESSNAFPSP